VKCVRERFKFVAQKTVVVSRNADHGTLSTSSEVVSSIAWSPREQSTQLRLAFIKMIEHEDARYNINLVTSLLEYIPMRVGSNMALDSAAGALVCCYGAVHAGTPSLSAIESYSAALRDLRTCFENPTLSKSTETLCAIYLIICIQV